MTKVCAVCGKEFVVCPSEAVKERHCSAACRHDLPARFWSKVDKTSHPNGCWVWKGRLRNGYGSFWIGTKATGKDRYAHRVAYELLVGPIPAGLDLLHSCDNPPCVNPAHTNPGTHAGNMRDMFNKGRRRNPSGVAVANHKMTPESVREIRERYSTNKWTLAEIGEDFKITAATVHQIVKYKTWKSI